MGAGCAAQVMQIGDQHGPVCWEGGGGEQTLVVVTGGRGRVFLLRIGQAAPGVLLALEKQPWGGGGRRGSQVRDKERCAVLEQAKAVEQCGGFDSEDFPPPLRLHGRE